MIEKEKYYSVNQIVKNDFLPWFRSHISMTQFLDSKEGRKILQPVIKTTLKKVSYFVSGENIANLLALAKEGKFTYNWTSLTKIK